MVAEVSSLQGECKRGSCPKLLWWRLTISRHTSSARTIGVLGRHGRELLGFRSRRDVVLGLRSVCHLENVM